MSVEAQRKLQAIKRQDKNAADALEKILESYAFHQDRERFRRERDLIIEQALELCGMVELHKKFQQIRRY